MGGTTIPRHVSSEGNNKIQISPVVYISHHWQSSLLHYPSNSVDQAIPPRSLRLDAWLGWLEDDGALKWRYYAHFTSRLQYFRCCPNCCCHLDGVVVLFMQMYSTVSILCHLLIMCHLLISGPHDHTSALLSHTLSIFPFIFTNLYIFNSQPHNFPCVNVFHHQS